MTPAGHAPISRTAKLAGGLYLSLVPLGVFSFVYVPAVLLVRGDPAATCRNIIASEWLFRGGTISHLTSQVIVVFLVLALYRLLKPVNKDHAVLMVVLALLGIPMSVLTEVNQLAVLRLLSVDHDAFTPRQLQAQALLFLELHRSGVLIAQVFWGLWLLVLGSLVFRSRFLPRLLGVAVLVGAIGYLVDSAAYLLFSRVTGISRFTFVGELLFPCWLLVKGVAVERRQEGGARLSGANPAV